MPLTRAATVAASKATISRAYSYEYYFAAIFPAVLLFDEAACAAAGKAEAVNYAEDEGEYDEASDDDGDDNADSDPFLLLRRQRFRQAAVDLAEDLRKHEIG